MRIEFWSLSKKKLEYLNVEMILYTYVKIYPPKFKN